MNRILHYEISQHLGEGPNGPAWLALDTGLQRAVALKQINGPHIASDDWRVPFLELTTCLNRIDDLRVGRFYSIEEADGARYVVRQYVDGKTVAALLANGPLDYTRWLDLALETAGIVKIIHDLGAVHGNIHSSNVMLDAAGRIRLLDAGLRPPDLSKLTDEQLSFVAPELRRGEPATVASDLYSLGAVLFHMLTGEPPSANTAFSRYPERLVPGVARLVLGRLMAPNPGERFGSADELIVTLQTMLSLGAEPGVELRPKKRGLTSRQYMGIAVLVLLLIIFWLVITSYQR